MVGLNDNAARVLYFSVVSTDEQNISNLHSQVYKFLHCDLVNYVCRPHSSSVVSHHYHCYCEVVSNAAFWCAHDNHPESASAGSEELCSSDVP